MIVFLKKIKHQPYQMQRKIKAFDCTKYTIGKIEILYLFFRLYSCLVVKIDRFVLVLVILCLWHSCQYLIPVQGLAGN